MCFAPTPAPTTRRFPLWLSVLLHLAPGLLLGVFIVAVVPLLENWNVDPVFALFAGIGLVPVPFELGYLAWYAHRRTGAWSINVVFLLMFAAAVLQTQS